MVFVVISNSFGLGFNSVTSKLRKGLESAQVSKRDPYGVVFSDSLVLFYFQLSRSQVIVFASICFCFISCLRIVHNSYEFALLLATS